ncbi:MAG: Gldg family protein [Gammaproteobacteria bacterium]|nr:Gldg family protein [Gammaproteobacteria bacterium]
MKVTPKSHLQIRLQNIAFVVLFIGVMGLLAWLSTRYVYQADWTAGARNTLSAPSQTLLKELGAVQITAYAREDASLRRRISELVARYQRHKPNLQLVFVNPDSAPEKVRALGVTVDGELVIEHAGRVEHLRELSEQALTNALARVARAGERSVVFLSGHGERDPHGEANHDLGLWARQLEIKGLKAHALSLGANPQIPDATSVLVIAAPQTDLLPGEVRLIQDYVKGGGNLLWLTDPEPLHGLKPLAEQLGVEFVPGVIVDPTAQLLGVSRPEFALVAEYGPHPITRDFRSLTLYPRAQGMEWNTADDSAGDSASDSTGNIASNSAGGWRGAAFLVTGAASWAETGALSGAISLDPGKGDKQGPLNIGVALVRDAPEADAGARGAPHEQRIVITGDGDFLSNTYLGNGGNLDLGLNIINWLAHDDSLISIPAKTAPDTALHLSRTASLLIGLGLLFVVPLMLLAGGLLIWLRRRKR